MKTLQNIVRNRYLFIGDIFLIICSYVLTILMMYRVELGLTVILSSWNMVILTVFAFTGFLYMFGCYRVYWVYGGTREYLRVTAACLCAGFLTDLLSVAHPTEGFFLKESLFTTLIAMFAVVGVRMAIRIMGKIVRMALNRSQRENPKSVLIVGAGELGVTLAKDIASNTDLNYHILGFIDDDPQKQKMIIYGHKVIGNTNQIPRLVGWLKPEEIIVAISSVEPAEKKRILELCSQQPCRIKILPGIADSLEKKKSVDFIREVEVEDLLARPAVKLDNSAIQEDITDKVVMVTGGGGSIGSELCRQIARFAPKKLVILDIYENNAFDLENNLHDDFPNCDVDVVIASVRDRNRMEQVFATYRPHIVFHAAAHKHVPLMENNAMEAVKNNVFGTYNTACCADMFGAKRFVLISTDKAVNPTNVMGATKRVCEMIIQAMQTKSETEFVAVRFGNVLNSNGSVLPRFKQQIRRGGPITVTHPDITRFFMTIPEAAQLVLQAATYASGGEIFVLDMGEPVRIYDMAKNLIRLSGLKEGKDIKIQITGLRPGEKLYEELLMEEEGLKKTAHAQIYIGQPFFDSMEKLEEHLDTLKQALETNDNEAVKNAVAKVVPTYVRKTEEEQIAAVQE
ncbi:MAG: polysaccharide biosynthesis protein [Clostridia bacterium]|nr:polysaccharide biosynthesis protein [Clostridia bacterium]